MAVTHRYSRGRHGRLACVLGEIDLVRALGLAGIRSAVSAVPGDPAGYSRHVVERLPWLDPWQHADEMVSGLIAWAKVQAERPVLFYNGDHDLLLVSRNRDVLGRWFDFVVADEDLVEALVDKDAFASLALSRALPVPPSQAFDAADTSPQDVGIRPPFVLKPVTFRHEVWEPISGGRKALRIDDERSLVEMWPRLRSQGPLIAQSLIEGPESSIESYHVYVRPSGQRACEFTGRKLRTIPAEYGETTALEITSNDDVLALGRELVDRLGLTGVAKFDFKRDPAGRLWLLEVNPRFNLWHHPGARAGANIPAAVYADLTGGEPSSCSVDAGARWCHPTRDARAARAQGMSFVHWGRDALGCEAKWGLSASDPMPFVRGVLLRRLASKVRAR